MVQVVHYGYSLLFCSYFAQVERGYTVAVGIARIVL
jgi:hypothetical protein